MINVALAAVLLASQPVGGTGPAVIDGAVQAALLYSL